MDEMREKRTRKLEKRIEPFASERERLDALENMRKWIAKLEQWDDARMIVEVEKRDLN